VTTTFLISYAALWTLVLIQTIVLLGLLAGVHRLRTAVPVAADAATAHALRGREFPDFVVTAVSGATIESRAFAARKLRAFLFVSPTCGDCLVTLDEIKALLLKTSGNVIVVCQSGATQCRQLAETYGLTVEVVPDPDLRLTRLVGVASVPSAVLVDEDDKIKFYGHPVRASADEDVAGISTVGVEDVPVYATNGSRGDANVVQ